MGERPQFEAFKRKALANPEIRRAYVAARVRNKRGVPHDHREYVEGCFRCDLSRVESDLTEQQGDDRG